MTLELLQQKLAAARLARETAIGQANAAAGAIQVLEELLRACVEPATKEGDG